MGNRRAPAPGLHELRHPRYKMNLKPLILTGLLGLAFAWSARSADQPNIVLILADDLGWTDLGCMGSTYYETPHIDRLAQEGMTFRSFYVCQNCAPTRAALMSGQYAPRTGVYTVNSLARGKEGDRAMRVPENATRLPLDKITVAQALHDAGYATGMFGKWHLGVNGDYHPGKRGFDEAIESSGRHLGFATHPPSDIPEGTYLADYLTDRAVDFIARHKGAPFFLYLPHFGVHSPYQAKKDLKEHFDAKPPAGGHRDPTYAAMIASVDESVGRILAALEEHGLAGRTLVLFASDNGGVGGYDTTEPPSSRRGITDNKPLRGGKGTLYEGGVRVPLLARWTGVIPPGAQNDSPAAHVDLSPTFMELAGTKLPDGYVLDGVSLAPLFRHPEATLPRRSVYWHFPGYLESYVHPAGWRTKPVSVIRSGDFKLLEFLEDGHVELYNLKDDVGETRNLAGPLAQQARRMQRELDAWRTSLGALMPVLKPADATPQK